MAVIRGPASMIRVPRLTLRTRLTVLYAALFGASFVAVIAMIELFVPNNFLVRHSSQAAPPGTASGGAAFSGADVGTHSVSVFSLIVLAVIGLLSLALGWWIAGRNLRPLRAIISTARDISARNLNERLGLVGPRDEFTELGETLDGLFGRLEASFEAQRRFVANASHELRTPLTAERSLLQVALADPDATEQTLRAACQEVLVLGGQQERLIEALLTLSCSERGVERWDPFDLAEVAARVVLDRRNEARRRGIHVETTLTAASVTGDPSLTESLVANLVDNALGHNLPAGRAEISTAITAGQVVLSVSNTGPVIPPDDVDRLFQPFQRLEGERIRHAAGYGLGLAIVRAIADAHGATLNASARPAGGLDIEVCFPIRQDSRRVASPVRGGSSRGA
jgi:signal transduction histidine kinase